MSQSQSLDSEIIDEAGGPGLVPAITWVDRESVPEGSWRLVTVWPLPVTPIHADFWGAAQRPVFQAASRAEFAFFQENLEPIVIDGYLYNRVPSSLTFPTPEQIAALEASVDAHHEEVVLRRWDVEVRSAMVAQIEALRSIDLASLTDEGLMAHIRQLSGRLADWLTVHFTHHRATARVLGRLEAFSRMDLALDDGEFFQLLAGLSPASVESATRLIELSDQVRRQPQLLAALAEENPWDNAQLRALLLDWLEHEGHSTVMYDYNVPTLAETPESLISLLREKLERPAGESQEAARRVKEERERAIQTIRGRLTDNVALTQFDRLLHEAQVSYHVRDDDSAVISRGCALMRYALLEAGRRFAAKGLLTEPARVLFLRRTELEQALSGGPPTDLRASSDTRAADHERQRSTVPPNNYGEIGMPPPVAGLSEKVRWAIISDTRYAARIMGVGGDGPISKTELRGVGAARGVSRGPACVISSEEDLGRVKPGDILVCPMTNPAWTVAFGKLAGLVTDYGGILSHPAIVAREFGFPAVVGARHATTTISDGQLIEVDGTAGFIRLL